LGENPGEKWVEQYGKKGTRNEKWSKQEADQNKNLRGVPYRREMIKGTESQVRKKKKG